MMLKAATLAALLTAANTVEGQIGMGIPCHKLNRLKLTIISQCAECRLGHRARPAQQRFRGIESWEDCRDKCNDDDQCSHFKFKVLL